MSRPSLRSARGQASLMMLAVVGAPEALANLREGAISADVSQYPYVMGQMAVDACVAAARGARLPARVDAPTALVTKDNIARAIAAFPKPVERYSDPFSRLLRGHG
jgi:ABC-type sugar transport system substrate-binding protein